MGEKAPADQAALDLQGKWRNLIEIHNHAKTVFLLAEEFDPCFADFIQPVLELRNGFEHIVRAKAAELNLNDEEGSDEKDYVPKSFDKAIGHEYRAFFDAADWFSVCIRERITKTLGRYSHDCISAVLPDYYPELRPKVDRACKEIAAIRGSKDIAKGKDLLAEVSRYRAVINELLSILDQIENAIPSLLDWKRKNAMAFLKNWVFVAFLGGIAITLLGRYLARLLGL